MPVTYPTELTKKNKEFLHIASHELAKQGKKTDEIDALLESIIPTILEHQQTGKTARNLYGPPSEWALSHSQMAHTKEENQPTNDNPWLMWLDASLLMLAIIGGMNGMMNLLGQGTRYGLLTLIVIGFGVGAGMYFMYHFVYREHLSTGKRPPILRALLFLGLATLAWSTVFFLAALIPNQINPAPHPLLTIAIGVTAFGVRHLLKKKYNIRNAMTPLQP